MHLGLLCADAGTPEILIHVNCFDNCFRRPL